MPTILTKKCHLCPNMFTGLKQRKFCSSTCRKKFGVPKHVRLKLSLANRGNIPWIKGKKMSSASKLKMSLSRTGTKSAHWKGDSAKYASKHQWVTKWKGKPKKCESCGRSPQETILHWSNIDHRYRRVLEDYRALCVRCHKRFDLDTGLCKH